MKKMFFVLILFSTSIKNMSIDDKLFEGIQKNDVKVVQEAIEQGANVKSFYNGILYQPVLVLAVYTPQIDIEILKILVEAGADIDIQDWAGWTPLMTAVIVNNLKVLEFLIRHGANVNFINKRGVYSSILERAVYKKNIVTVKLLVENGADIFFNSYKSSIFEHAKEVGNLEIIAFLEEARIKYFQEKWNPNIPKVLVKIVLEYWNSDYKVKYKREITKRNCDICVII